MIKSAVAQIAMESLDISVIQQIINKCKMSSDLCGITPYESILFKRAAVHLENLIEFGIEPTLILKET